MDVTSIFDVLLDAINTFIGFMSDIEFYGMTALSVAIFGFIITCFWRFILSPLFGVSGGSLSAGASDVVKSSANRAYDKAKSYDNFYDSSNMDFR